MLLQCLITVFVLSYCTPNGLINLQQKVAYAEQTVKWDDRSLYDGSLLGKNVSVEGDVVSTYNSGQGCFLNFREDWEKIFFVVIPKDAFYAFGTPEKDYYMKKIMVTGTLEDYNGKPEIVVVDPEQIIILQQLPNRT